MTQRMVSRGSARGRSNAAVLNLQRCRRQRTEDLQRVNRVLEEGLRERLGRLAARIAQDRT